MKHLFLAAVLGLCASVNCNEDRMIEELEGIIKQLRQNPGESSYHPRNLENSDENAGFPNNRRKKNSDLLEDILHYLNQHLVSKDTANGKPPPAPPWKKDKIVKDVELLNRDMEKEFENLKKVELKEVHSNDGKFVERQAMRKNELYAQLLSDISELVYSTANNIRGKEEVKTRLVYNINSLFSLSAGNV